MSKDKHQHPKKHKSLNKFLRFTTAGFQIGITIWLGNELGKWLDYKFNKNFLETSVTLFAIFISLYLLISQVIKISKDD